MTSEITRLGDISLGQADISAKRGELSLQFSHINSPAEITRHTDLCFFIVSLFDLFDYFIV